MIEIDHLTDAELKEMLLHMSPEAAAEYRKLGAGSAGLLALNLRKMDREAEEEEK